MKIETNKLHLHTDEEVWVCDTNWRKREMVPTIGIFKSRGKHYDPSFHKLKRNGEPYAKRISLFNQARGWKSKPLSVFTTKSECVEYYLKECNSEIAYFSNKIKNIIHGS